MTSSATTIASPLLLSSFLAWQKRVMSNQVQGPGYFVSEVETFMAALKLENFAVVLQLETSVATLELETVWLLSNWRRRRTCLRKYRSRSSIQMTSSGL
jgi:hypothetical protein